MSDTAILADTQDNNGETAETDYQNVLKVEFDKLHREYRSLENKRHGIAQRDGYILKRTNKIVPLLELDHTELQHELVNATCRAHRRNADVLATNMKEALKTFDLYQLEIAKKIKQIAEIERHVDRITDKVIKQRFKMLALHGLSKTMAQRERELARAEDKLYHYTCSFNLQISENKRLRDEIMDFLMERGQFFKLHNSVKRQIAQGKKKMLSIVQQAISTYDNRDEAMAKVKALRERELKENKQHGMDVQEFERTLHHDKSILDFIKTKLKTRRAFEDASDRRVRLGSGKERELDAILKKYRRSFKKILTYSHTNSILDLVDKYNSLDVDNFETFKYITNLNNECEILRDAIEALKSNIEVAHTEVENREREQRSTQQNLQMGIISEEEKMDNMKHQLRQNKSRNRDIFATIAAALSLTDCDTSPIMRLLGNISGLNENNVRLCLQQLDIKITEMRVERDRLRDIKTNVGNVNALRPVVGKAKQQPSAGGPFLPKMIMLHGDSVDDEDDSKIFEQEPYYYNEMKEYIVVKAIEDKLIDPEYGRKGKSEAASGASIGVAGTDSSTSRRTLVDKLRQSQHGEGRRRRKLTHDLNSKTSIHDDDEDDPMAAHKSETIIKLGNEFLKRQASTAGQARMTATSKEDNVQEKEEEEEEEEEILQLEQEQDDAPPPPPPPVQEENDPADAGEE